MTTLVPRLPGPAGPAPRSRGDMPRRAGRKVALGDTAPAFSAALHTGAYRWTLDLRGHLRAHTAVALDVQVEQLLGILPTHVVVRLYGLRTVDEVGARRLLRLRSALEARGGSVTITGASPGVRTMLSRLAGGWCVTN